MNGKAVPQDSDLILHQTEKTVLVAEHHHVLLPWTRMARKTGSRYHIVTLDHHTDILPAFGRSSIKGDFDASSDDSVLRNLALLRHDEHIDWALRAGAAESVQILSHENFTESAHSRIRVSCDPVWPDPQSILNGTPEAVSAAEQVLESDFLRRQISEIPMPLILDLDLDYFLCEAALHPKNPDFFRELISCASLITISLEENWQKILRFRNETLDSHEIYRTLQARFL